MFIWEYPDVYTILVTVGCAAWVCHVPTTWLTHGLAVPEHVGDVSTPRTNPTQVWAEMFVKQLVLAAMIPCECVGTTVYFCV